MTTWPADDEAVAIARAYDFSGDIKVIAVGGGAGTLLATLLKAHPRLTGVVFDRPHVIANAERLFKESQVVDRAAWAGGDFFAALPGGADIYLLKSVLHNWDDEAAVRLLQCCRRAMAEGARLLIAEPPATPDTAADEGCRIACGRERTEADYRALLQATGFDWLRVIATDSPLSLIEGIAVRVSTI